MCRRPRLTVDWAIESRPAATTDRVTRRECPLEGAQPKRYTPKTTSTAVTLRLQRLLEHIEKLPDASLLRIVPHDANTPHLPRELTESAAHLDPHRQHP